MERNFNQSSPGFEHNAGVSPSGSSQQLVNDALTDSELLLRLIEFRQSGFIVSNSDRARSSAVQADRVRAMLNLKRASEHFNAALTPVNAEQQLVLRELHLEPLLSASFWHSILLNSKQPEQGIVLLDDLCSTVLRASHTLLNHQIHASNSEPNASYRPGSKNHLTKESLNPSLARQSAFKESGHAQEVAQVDSRFGGVYGFVAGFAALLLAVLAVSLFAPGLPEQFYKILPAGSTAYRLVMIAVLIILTTSTFLLISKMTKVSAVATVLVDRSKSNKGTLASLFDIGASRRRIILGALGPAFLGLGLGISISAGFGTFGFSVLLDGIYQTFKIPLWISQSVLTIVFYILAWFWGRVPIGLGTITTLLLIGPAISFGAGLPPDNLAFTGNLLAFLIGLFLFAGGISLAAAAALGPDGVTALSLAAERRHKWSVPRATFLWDITAIAAGIILGGNFGVATLIGLFAVPYIIHYTIPPLRRLVG